MSNFNFRRLSWKYYLKTWIGTKTNKKKAKSVWWLFEVCLSKNLLKFKSLKILTTKCLVYEECLSLFSFNSLPLRFLTAEHIHDFVVFTFFLRSFSSYLVFGDFWPVSFERNPTSSSLAKNEPRITGKWSSCIEFSKAPLNGPYNLLTDKFLSIVNKHAPLKKKFVKGSNALFMNREFQK